MGLIDFTRYDKDAPGSMLRALGVALGVSLLPQPVWVAFEREVVAGGSQTSAPRRHDGKKR